MTVADYNNPLNAAGEFLGKTVPTFHNYQRTYHIHYLRYLYFMCVQDSKGDYPDELDYDQLQNALEEMKSSNKCHKKISMILIGEAPPVAVDKYFYNTVHADGWDTTKGCPNGKGFGWINEIKHALFPVTHHASKLDFLKDCAKCGLLLLDLFPYAIDYSEINRKATYKRACVSAFDNRVVGHFPTNILDTLTHINCCVTEDFSFGFGLIRFGTIILSNGDCCDSFNAWTISNMKHLTPPGNIETLRLPAHVTGHMYLRICHKSGPFNPTRDLLIAAGFGPC